MNSRRVAVVWRQYEEEWRWNRTETFFFSLILLHQTQFMLSSRTPEPGWCSWLTQPGRIVWNGKIKSPSFFLPIAFAGEKKHSWYLCFEPLTLCLLTASVKKPRRKEKVLSLWKRVSFEGIKCIRRQVKFYRRSEIVEFVRNLSNILRGLIPSGCKLLLLSL